MPVRAKSISEAIEIVSRVRTAAAEVMNERGLTTLLADEGGLSPGFETGREALQLMVDATKHAGLIPGEDIVIAIDVACSSLKGPNGTYRLTREGRDLSRDQMIEMMQGWVNDFPIASIEDGLDEDDWEGWKTMTESMGDQIRLVGDDLFTTNVKRVDYGIKNNIANGVLVKVNQNGTLSGTLSVIAAAKAAGYAPVVSARSGETEDNYIADIAVGTAAGQIKIGSTRTSDRLSKYNQLLRIEEFTAAPYAGTATLNGRYR
jgi:enolase